MRSLNYKVYKLIYINTDYCTKKILKVFDGKFSIGGIFKNGLRKI